MDFDAIPQTRSHAHHRVLVVEADAPSRHALVRALNIQGYNALWAHSLAEALVQLPKSPHTLILDLSLPDGSASLLLRRVRDLQLTLRIALLSGPHHPLLTPIQKFHPDTLFTKPLHLPTILDWLDTTPTPQPARPPAVLTTGH